MRLAAEAKDKAARLEAARRQVEAERLRECTFKPQLAPNTDKIYRRWLQRNNLGSPEERAKVPLGERMAKPNPEGVLTKRRVQLTFKSI